MAGSDLLALRKARLELGRLIWNTSYSMHGEWTEGTLYFVVSFEGRHVKEFPVGCGVQGEYKATREVIRWIKSGGKNGQNGHDARSVRDVEKEITRRIAERG